METGQGDRDIALDIDHASAPLGIQNGRPGDWIGPCVKVGRVAAIEAEAFADVYDLDDAVPRMDVGVDARGDLDEATGACGVTTAVFTSRYSITPAALTLITLGDSLGEIPDSSPVAVTST